MEDPVVSFRILTREHLSALLFVVAISLPCGYFLALYRPLRSLVEHTPPLLLHAVEVFLCVSFCAGVLGLVVSSVFLSRMKDRLTRYRVAENAAIELAKHDPLTGLPNRRKLDDSFDLLMDDVSSDQYRAVLMLDVDGFKPVNDVYGHAVGDILLRQFADRLQEEIRGNGLVARVGGDEFAILSPVLDNKSDASVLARRLLASIQKPFHISGRDIRVGSGIGISLFPADGHSASELLRRADIALYRAKTSGTSLFRFFEKEMDASILHRSLLEQRLRRAMANADLVPEFLPIVRLADNKIVGFEALARWYDQDFGHVSPVDFIPIAEDAGMISELTEDIVFKACQCAGQWPKDVNLNINISSLKLQEQSFPLKLAAILADAGVSPSRLILDITESALQRNRKLAYPVLRQLTDSGICLALDDYGLGSSSLNFLRDFPIGAVKIHENFTSGILANAECSAMVEAILVLARGLNVEVIAEGLEDAAIHARLKQLGCQAAQGRYFGLPVTADKALDLLANDRSPFLPSSVFVQPTGGSAVRAG